MEKSIENIWTKAFLNSEDLKAPKINDLYNRKSELLLEKLKRTYTADNRSLLPIALVVGIGFCAFKYYLVAIYGVFILISLFFYNQYLLKSLESIQINTTSYDYLLVYKNGINNIIRKTTMLLGFVFPLVVITGCFLFFRNTETFNTLMSNTSIRLIGIISSIAIVLGILGVAIYRLTTKLVYGTYLSKLDDIIADMEELRG